MHISQFSPVFFNLGKSGKIWEKLGKTGKIWENLGKSGKHLGFRKFSGKKVIGHVVICGNIVGNGTALTNLNYNTISNKPDITVSRSSQARRG